MVRYISIRNLDADRCFPSNSDYNSVLNKVVVVNRLIPRSLSLTGIGWPNMIPSEIFHCTIVSDIEL
jgi:hypothetical protein